MKTAAKLTAMAFVGGAVLFAALNPDGGVLFHSPLSAVGLGLIGLGLVVEMKQRQARAAAVRVKA